MKKHLQFLIFSLLYFHSYAQWESQATGFSSPSQGIYQIVIPNQTVAWAAGYDGSGGGVLAQEYTRTTDGGQTWVAGSVTAAASTYDWSCLAALDDQTAWAMFYDATAGLYGYIYKTSDGGQTWTQQGSSLFQESTSFGDVIYFWDANNGVAIGDPANGEFEIYTTVDGGATWTNVAADNIPDPKSGEYGLVRGLDIGSDGALWFLTNKGRVYKSTDMGYTWNAYETTLTGQLEVVACKDANNAWVRKGANMRRTTDGGTTWTTVAPVSGHFFQNDLCFVPTTYNAIISTGDNPTPTSSDRGSSYSLDGGDNWVTIDSDIQHIAVNFFDNLTGWSGGFNTDEVTDGIFKYTDAFVADGIQTVTDDSKFQLYPNPGNGLFYFSFDAQNSEPIHITVTNTLGQIVFDQTYRDKSQTWLRSIDLRNDDKGIYFLNVENDGQQSTQKLIVQ